MHLGTLRPGATHRVRDEKPGNLSLTSISMFFQLLCPEGIQKTGLDDLLSSILLLCLIRMNKNSNFLFLSRLHKVPSLQWFSMPFYDLGFTISLSGGCQPSHLIEFELRPSKASGGPRSHGASGGRGASHASALLLPPPRPKLNFHSRSPETHSPSPTTCCQWCHCVPSSSASHLADLSPLSLMNPCPLTMNPLEPPTNVPKYTCQISPPSDHPPPQPRAQLMMPPNQWGHQLKNKVLRMDQMVQEAANRQNVQTPEFWAGRGSPWHYLSVHHPSAAGSTSTCSFLQRPV